MSPLQILAKCPLAKCPLAKCPLAKCPLAKCPDFGPHRLMSIPDTCIGIRVQVSICGGMEHFIFRLMYV